MQNFVFFNVSMGMFRQRIFSFCHITTFIVTPSQVWSLQKSFAQYSFGIKTPWSTDFLPWKFSWNSIKFPIYRTRSKHLLHKLNTFINLKITTKLRVLEFISKVIKIYRSWLASLLRELRLTSSEANCLLLAARIIFQSCMPCGPILKFIATQKKLKGQKLI